MSQQRKTYSLPDVRLSLEELKTFLWGAATLLRGQIDATGYKEYIFPLLFFKRISDVYDEQFEGYCSEAGADYAKVQCEELAIKIPDGAHWRNVRNVTENVGQRLVDAFKAIEIANPGKVENGRVIGGLEGIFGPKDSWTEKAKMPDHIITSLIEHFSQHTLSLANCPADEMGQAYEYLVGKFADDAGNTAQEFYTNRTVVTLMAEILQPQSTDSIYDPTCGSGGMLVKCLDYLRENGKEWREVKVFGQEINGLTSSIARMNLYLNGVEDFSIACADTLASPKFLDGSSLRKYDIVLANPPYSIKEWNRTAFENDKYGRNFLGTPPQGRADYAFIQHIIASMNEKHGRCAILLPHGVLNRDEEASIRMALIEKDILETVIGLGRNLFYNSGLESCIMICNNNKNSFRKNRVLFIEAENHVIRQGKNAYLSDQIIAYLMEAYKSEHDIPNLSKWVENSVILENQGNLNIKSYVKVKRENSNISSFDIDFNTLRNHYSTLFKAIEVDVDTDEVCPFSFDAKLDKSNWKLVKLGNVASEYSERVNNPSISEYDCFISSNCIDRFDFTINKTTSIDQITSAQKAFKKDDYLLVRRSLYGSDFRERAPRAQFDGTCSADILTIRENRNMLAEGFLIYILYSPDLWDYIVANSTGSLTRRIKWKQLASYEFLLPPIDVQKNIADKLWAAYRLKESYKRLLTATDEMVKSQFIEMFGNLPIDGTIADVVERNIKSVKKNFSPEDIIEYIDISSVDSSSHTIVETSQHVVSHAPSRAQQCVESGDILVSTVRPINRNIAVVKSELSNLVASTGFCVLRPKDGFREYILSIVQSDPYTEQMCDKASGGLYPAVNNGDVLSFGIHIPDESQLKKVTYIYRQADKSKFELKQCIDNIDNIIKSLINNHCNHEDSKVQDENGDSPLLNYLDVYPC